MRVVFMGTPAFAVPSLSLLVERGFDVVGVVTQPDRPAGRGGAVSPPPVKLAAIRENIPVYQPPTLRTSEALTDLRSLAPDAIVVVAFGQILRRSVLDLAPLGCVNVHPSLLPKLRGASPIQSAIRQGDAETGVTIMLMNERMDAGPILSQESFPILPKDNALVLGERLAKAGAELLVDTLLRLARGTIIPRAQNDEEATYCAPLRKVDAEIDWSRPASDIDRICRAQTPWPGCESQWNGRQVRLLDVVPLAGWSGSLPPGHVFVTREIGSGEQVLAVATGRGALVLRRLQLAGKRPLLAAEFRRGQPGFVGSVLGRAAD